MRYLRIWMLSCFSILAEEADKVMRIDLSSETFSRIEWRELVWRGGMACRSVAACHVDAPGDANA